MERFKKTPGGNGFNYVYENTIGSRQTVLLKMPSISANKRGINDIGFMASSGLILYATISSNPDIDDADIWQEINAYDEINKTTSYIKIKNTRAASGRVMIRAILN